MSANVAPAADRHFLMFSCTCRVCATTSLPPTTLPLASDATQPETKTSRPTVTTWVKWLTGSDIPGTMISRRCPCIASLLEVEARLSAVDAVAPHRVGVHRRAEARAIGQAQ